MIRLIHKKALQVPKEGRRLLERVTGDVTHIDESCKIKRDALQILRHETWLINTCDMTQLYMYHDSTHVCDMTWFICVTRLIHAKEDALQHLWPQTCDQRWRHFPYSEWELVSQTWPMTTNMTHDYKHVTNVGGTSHIQTGRWRHFSYSTGNLWPQTWLIRPTQSMIYVHLLVATFQKIIWLIILLVAQYKCTKSWGSDTPGSDPLHKIMLYWFYHSSWLADPFPPHQNKWSGRCFFVPVQYKLPKDTWWDWP